MRDFRRLFKTIVTTETLETTTTQTQPLGKALKRFVVAAFLKEVE